MTETFTPELWTTTPEGIPVLDIRATLREQVLSVLDRPWSCGNGPDCVIVGCTNDHPSLVCENCGCSDAECDCDEPFADSYEADNEPSFDIVGLGPIETGAGGTTLTPDARFVLVGLPFHEGTREFDQRCPFDRELCVGNHNEAQACSDEAFYAALPIGVPILDPHGEEHRILALVRKLDRAIKRGDRLAVAVIESILGFGYADRFMREA